MTGVALRNGIRPSASRIAAQDTQQELLACVVYVFFPRRVFLTFELPLSLNREADATLSSTSARSTGVPPDYCFDSASKVVVGSQLDPGDT